MTNEQTPKKRRKLNKKQKDLIFYILVLAFPMTQFAIFYLGVNFNSILLAFRSYDVMSGQYIWAGLNNFKEVFADLSNMAMFSIAFRNSIIAFVFGMIFGTLFG